MVYLTILVFLFYTTGYPGLVKIPPQKWEKVYNNFGE
jgi:hypothetical protein